VGAVQTIQAGPTLGTAGQTVLVTATVTTGAGYRREQVDLFGSAKGKINLLWSHTKNEHMFMLPKERGEEDAYGWLFEQAGTVIRVYGSRSTFPPPMNDRNGKAPPVSVKSLPTELYCWWSNQ